MSLQPGDLCQILNGLRIKHWSCNQYPDGTVTDVRTGEVLES